jgi:hypothetical protein
MDVKFLERIPGTAKRLYQFTAIDDCTRIRVLKIYDECLQHLDADYLVDRDPDRRCQGLVAAAVSRQICSSVRMSAESVMCKSRQRYTHLPDFRRHVRN